MRNIYFFGQNKSIALYPFRNQIFRVSLDGSQAVHPVLLCGDHFGDLSDVQYRGTVYFCYRNRRNEIMIQNVMDRMPEYKLDEDAFYEEADHIFPQLVNWQERLLLLCFVKRPQSADVTLEGIFPFEDRKFKIPDVFSAEASYGYQNLGEKLFLFVREMGRYHFYVSEGMGEFHEFLNGQGTEVENGGEGPDEENYLLLKEEQLLEKEKIIESVKVQYEDLMNTAIQYREEAKKWREKYLTKK